MEIQDIKQHLKIETVLNHYGIKPNRNNLLKCPFHQDDKASLQLYPKTNTWHCFGCGKGTDTIDLIKYKENCTTHEAIIKAKSLINIKLKPMETTEQLKPLTGPKRILVLETAFKYFVQSLKATSKAQEYLKSRTIDYTKILAGYDNHNFHQIKRTGKELQELYLQLGLIFPDRQGRKDSYHSRFDGCIVFPTFDEQGNIVNLYGRKTDVKEGEGGHYKLPGEHQGLYPKYPQPNTEIVLITECIIDAATLLQHEFITEKYTLLSLYGAKIWTEEHTKAIQNLHQLKEIIFALDGDKEGKEGTAKHSEAVRKINSEIKISYIEIPEGEDINSIAQSHEDPQVFTEFINNRKIISSTTHFFLSQEKKENSTVQAIKESGTPEIKLSEKEKLVSIAEKNEAAPQVLRLSEPIQANGTNGQENHEPTGKLNTTNNNHITYETEQLKITLQGGIELYNLKRLRTTLQIQLKVNVYNDYRDTVDLYSNSQRKRLIQEVSEKLEQSTTEISKVITDLTNQLENYRNKEIERKRKEEEAEKEKDKETFSAQQMQSGLHFLKNKQLMKKTLEGIKKIGLIGEEKNGLLLFLIYLTRMFKEPLHAIVQGKSNSGKTHLLKKIIGLVPKIHYKCTTALTENALFYSLKGFWRHMILLIEDLEGAYKSILSVQELMSNQSLHKFTTVTNNKTGKPEQMELHVEGPVTIAGATTKDKIYEDTANRSYQIQVTENPQHESSVLEFQTRYESGLIDKGIEQEVQIIFKTAQLQLEPAEVVIPFGNELKIPEHVFKKFRTNKQYLSMIKASAFWHQKQRVWKTDKYKNPYIEATLEDVYWANYLCKESLLRKSDELSPQLRSYFESIKTDLKNEKKQTFYSKAVRQKYRMNPMKMSRYLSELEERGFIKRTGGNRKTGYEYEVIAWDDYTCLQQGMDILDKILENLQKKYSVKN